MLRAARDDETITRLLSELNAGDASVLEAIFPLLYDELRQIAHHHRARWHGDTTMGTTALVHEAYLRLSASSKLTARTRLHFMRIASRAMRQILTNYARNRCADRRGGALSHVSLDNIIGLEAASLSADEQLGVLMDVDEALTRLEREDARLKDVVECRFFGGLSIDETAGALGISSATVRRDWVLARAWLLRELSQQAGERIE